MENRPIGREKRVVSGGAGIKKSGNGIGKTVSNRNVKRTGPSSGDKKPGLFGDLFRKK